MTKKLDGKKVSFQIRSKLKKRVDLLKSKNVIPCLAVIVVGDDSASKIYVKNKRKVASSLNIKTIDRFLPSTISENEIISIIDDFNKDPNVHGILVQLPLPKNLNEQKIIESINPEKDVDGFHPLNIGRLFTDQSFVTPCTPNGILRLLKYYNIDMDGRKVLIIGRSRIVGIPMTALMINNNATVTVAHSHTKNLKKICRDSDIVIVSMGLPNFLDKTYFNKHAVVIDVGINHFDNKLVGDVNYSSVNGNVAYLTPVPGGVGPITISMLMEQTIKIAERSVVIGTRTIFNCDSFK